MTAPSRRPHSEIYMPRVEFLRNVRRAIRDMGPQDVVRVPPSAGSANLNGIDLWLVMGTVEGFDEMEFDDLPAADRTALALAVDAFGGVATQVNPTRPATEDQFRSAKAALDGIVSLLMKHNLV
jgi:hypothetical protein